MMPKMLKHIQTLKQCHFLNFYLTKMFFFLQFLAVFPSHPTERPSDSQNDRTHFFRYLILKKIEKNLPASCCPSGNKGNELRWLCMRPAVRSASRRGTLGRTAGLPSFCEFGPGRRTAGSSFCEVVVLRGVTVLVKRPSVE